LQLPRQVSEVYKSTAIFVVDSRATRNQYTVLKEITWKPKTKMEGWH
jgi:hypothetical protein